MLSSHNSSKDLWLRTLWWTFLILTWIRLHSTRSLNKTQTHFPNSSINDNRYHLHEERTQLDSLLAQTKQEVTMNSLNSNNDRCQVRSYKVASAAQEWMFNLNLKLSSKVFTIKDLRQQLWTALKCVPQTKTTSKVATVVSYRTQ